MLNKITRCRPKRGFAHFQMCLSQDFFVLQLTDRVTAQLNAEKGFSYARSHTHIQTVTCRYTLAVKAIKDPELSVLA